MMILGKRKRMQQLAKRSVRARAAARRAAQKQADDVVCPPHQQCTNGMATRSQCSEAKSIAATIAVSHVGHMAGRVYSVRAMEYISQCNAAGVCVAVSGIRGAGYGVMNGPNTITKGTAVTTYGGLVTDAADARDRPKQLQTHMRKTPNSDVVEDGLHSSKSFHVPPREDLLKLELVSRRTSRDVRAALKDGGGSTGTKAFLVGHAAMLARTPVTRQAFVNAQQRLDAKYRYRLQANCSNELLNEFVRLNGVGYMCNTAARDQSNNVRTVDVPLCASGVGRVLLFYVTTKTIRPFEEILSPYNNGFDA
jgi:hypothetical protein